MKKNSSNIKPITKQYLDKTLDKRFAASKADLDKTLDKRFAASKADLDKTLDKRFGEYDAKMDKRFGEMNIVMDKKFVAFQNYFDFRIEPIERAQKENDDFKASVLDSLDWLVGAFKKFEAEHLILSANYSGITDTLESHEKRIDRLESQTA